MLNTLRQCRRTMLSHAAWSPPRHRWMMSSMDCGSVGRASADMHGERGTNDGNARMITCGTLVSQPFQADSAGLSCDGVSVTAIAEAAGTPFYIYSARAIREAYRAIDSAFTGYPHAIHYALKANSTLAIARLLRALGSRADANSGGEIDVALRAGFLPRDVV